MTFTAVGSLQAAENAVAATTTTFSLTTTTGATHVFAEFACNTSFVTAVTSSRCTWTQFAPVTGASSFTFNSPFNSNVWKGTVNSVGADTVSVTFNASMGGANCRFDARQFNSSTGIALLDVFGTVNSSGGTNTWASLTPAGPGELFWGWCEDAASAVSGSTSGFVYEPDLNGNASGYCLSVSAAYAPVWGDSNHVAGVMVLVTGTAPTQAAGALAVSGTAAAAGAVTAAGAVALAGAASATISGSTASGALSVTGTSAARAPVTAAGSVTVTGTAAAAAPATAAGSLGVTGTAAAKAAAAAVGALVLNGTTAAAAPAAAAGSFTLNGTAAATGPGATAAGALALAAAAAAQAAAATAGLLAVTGSAATRAAAAAAGVITLTGTATGTAPPPPFTVGALTAATAAQATLTAATQTTGGPG